MEFIGNATQKKLQNGVTCPELRGEVTCTDGKWHVFCKDKQCQKKIPYANWSDHCKRHHADNLPSGKDGNDVSQETEAKKPLAKRPLSKPCNVMSLGRGGLLASEKAQKSKKAISEGKDVVPNETESKKRCGQGANHGTQHCKGAKANDSSNGTVASEKKSKVASKKKSNPE